MAIRYNSNCVSLNDVVMLSIKVKCQLSQRQDKFSTYIPGGRSSKVENAPKWDSASQARVPNQASKVNEYVSSFSCPTTSRY